MLALPTALLAFLLSAEPQINPDAPAWLAEPLREWTFDRGDEGWAAEHECASAAEGGLLRVRSTGADPFLHCKVDLAAGQLLLMIRARSRTGGDGAVYWTTDQSPQRGEDKVAHFPLKHDGQWHETAVELLAPGRLTDLRIDPGGAPGEFDVDWIRLIRRRPHPLSIERVERADGQVSFEVKNLGAEPLQFSAAGQTHTLAGGASVSIDRPIDGTRPLEVVSLELQAKDLPPVRRTIFVHNPQAQADWIVRPLGDFTLRIAPDGSMARIESNGQLAAIVGPLVHCQGKLPELKLVADAPALRRVAGVDGHRRDALVDEPPDLRLSGGSLALDPGHPTVQFQGQGVALSISAAGKEISVLIDSQQTCEGPVVRAIGDLEQGLFAGLEYLGKGEKSSSKLDIETVEHLRFAPDPLKVTVPLMTLVTDRVSAAMTWKDMQLQPVYATPNFFDAAGDHRMTLRGKRIEATIRLDHASLEETIRWAVARVGLPPLPEAPRSPQEQWKTCLAALNGPLKTEAGWGHCVQDNWARQPFADMASTVWRLSGEAPALPRLVPGGAHVPNDSIYFVTGRAQQWLDHQSAQAKDIIRQQQPDGSFRYDGPYRRGHFEDTASGVCARPAALLLEYAYVSGDPAALRAGVRTLEYMKRFRTPRGAQVWEVPLHTPDLLASAYLVWAYVRGYELTGQKDYLEQARKWALSGIPFVYLWSRYPIMLYSTPPVFGATDWRHSWFGLPVQWVGLVYAYSLNMLAPHDNSLDWNHLARGILLSGEQQQYPTGPHVGLLPDSFAPASQQRRPADINPCALVSLRLVLDGQLDALCVASAGQHRIAAPFPTTIRDGQAHVRAKAGVKYQVIIDGRRIVELESHGDDVVLLR